MAEILYKDLKKYLADLRKNSPPLPFAPVYLIHGEEFLYKTVVEELLGAILPGSARNFGYEPVDDADGSVFDAIERINTYSFLSGSKVVALLDSRLFDSKQGDLPLLENAKKAFDADDLQKGARYLLRLISLLNLSLDDLRGESRDKAFSGNVEMSVLMGDGAWIEALVSHCRERNLSVPSARDDAKTLSDAIAKGFPPKNHLIITTVTVDKRHTLYKTIRASGGIIDCSVPRGERKADKTAQESLLRERMNAILPKYAKKMGIPAFRALCETTGFDPRIFSGNLEMLVNYIGDRPEITVADIETLIKRTKQDPIFELTGAIANRNPGEALFYLKSLLSSGIHPLQALSAMVKQVRKLLVYKDFAIIAFGRTRLSGMQLSQFEKTVIPKIIEYDQALIHRLEKKNSESVDDASGVKRKGGKKAKPKTDLPIGVNPKNPYPVYLNLLKSENFTAEELVLALDRLFQADLRMKSTGQDQVLILEETIMKICRKEN